MHNEADELGHPPGVGGDGARGPELDRSSGAASWRSRFSVGGHLTSGAHAVGGCASLRAAGRAAAPRHRTLRSALRATMRGGARPSSRAASGRALRRPPRTPDPADRGRRGDGRVRGAPRTCRRRRAMRRPAHRRRAPRADFAHRPKRGRTAAAPVARDQRRSTTVRAPRRSHCATARLQRLAPVVAPASAARLHRASATASLAGLNSACCRVQARMPRQARAR